ncbi:hypothetical protein [Lysinibacillus sp. fls2-241-R2A-57]|nr:hypothetical protein [Lysinibacillus sp. fls2-241-R2A-57]
MCESEATATGVFCAKAKRQQQQMYNHVTVINLIYSIMVSSYSVRF